MTSHRYPTLLVAALAATFIGAAAAQTQSDTSRMPANKGMPQADQTQPSQNQPDKMKGEEKGTNGQSQSNPIKGQAQSNPTNGQAQTDPKKHQAQNSPTPGPSESSRTKDHHAMADHRSKANNNAASEQSGMEHEAMNSTKTGKHMSKSTRQSEEAGTPDEKAYREALRDCVKQQSDSQRDSCLDSAIERFHRNA